MCAVSTQGHSGEYTTDFKLSFSSHGNTWTTYKDENGAEMVRLNFIYIRNITDRRIM